jgi:glycosyltransferase involved in cell wall biosynthesis/predicted O-methyltransferase YrrM
MSKLEPLLQKQRTLSALKKVHSGALNIFTHLSIPERLLLYSLAMELPDYNRVVEIGSYLGASTCFLAAGARSRTGKVYAVDTWTNLAMSEGSKDTYQEFLKNTEPLREWIVPLRGFSHEVANSFSEKIDLLFIDGDHSYEAVQTDLKAWLPKVRDGGIVAFHDYSWAEGVRKAIREFVVPLQIEGGHHLDSIYWTRISHKTGLQSTIQMQASIIVPTYGRPQYLMDALVSIQKQDFPPEDYEILVIDNSPKREAETAVEKVSANGLHSVRYVFEPNIGLHNARHRGAKEAQGEILVFVDDDVIVPPHWLRSLVKPYDDPQVACTGGKVIAHWEEDPPKLPHDFVSGYLSLLDLGNETRELTWPENLYGCNMSVRKSALYEAGGFNPDAIGNRRLIWLRGDGETGLQRKILALGYKEVYEPTAWLFHRIPPSRLETNYLFWRGFTHGISDSYTSIRLYRPSRFRTFCQAGRSFLRSFRCFIASIAQRENLHQIKTRIQAHYWYGRGHHQLRAALSKSLRAHIEQETYWTC